MRNTTNGMFAATVTPGLTVRSQDEISQVSGLTDWLTGWLAALISSCCFFLSRVPSWWCSCHVKQPRVQILPTYIYPAASKMASSESLPVTYQSTYIVGAGISGNAKSSSSSNSSDLSLWMVNFRSEIFFRSVLGCWTSNWKSAYIAVIA